MFVISAADPLQLSNDSENVHLHLLNYQKYRGNQIMTHYIIKISNIL